MKFFNLFITRCALLIFAIALDVYAIYYVAKTWDLVGKGPTNNYTSLLIGIKWLIVMFMMVTILFFALLTCCNKHYHYWQHIPIFRFMYFKSIWENKVDNNFISSSYLFIYSLINIFFTFISMMGMKIYQINGKELYIAYVSLGIAILTFFLNIRILIAAIKYNKEERKQLPSNQVLF